MLPWEPRVADLLLSQSVRAELLAPCNTRKRTMLRPAFAAPRVTSCPYRRKSRFFFFFEGGVG